MTVVKDQPVKAPSFKTKAFTNIAGRLAGQYGNRSSTPPPKKNPSPVQVNGGPEPAIARPGSGPMSSIRRPPPKEGAPMRTIDRDTYSTAGGAKALQNKAPARASAPIQGTVAAKGVTSIPTGGQSPSFVAAVNEEPRTANAGSRAEYLIMNRYKPIHMRMMAEGGVPAGYHRMPDGSIMSDSAHAPRMAAGGPLEREREFERMQEEYDAEVARSGGSGAGLAGFLANLRDLALGDETMGLMDIMRRGGVQNVPEGYYSERIEMYGDDPRMFDIPEEVLLAASVMGPGKGKGITSLVDEAKGVSRLGDELAESIRRKKPAIESPEPGRDYGKRPMTGREFLGYPPDPQDELREMRRVLSSDVEKPVGASAEEMIEGIRRGRSTDRVSSKPDYRGRKPEKKAGGGKPGLYANIHAKRKRIAAGSGERMRQPGSPGAPTAENFRQAAKTAKRAGGGHLMNMGYYGKSYR